MSDAVVIPFPRANPPARAGRDSEQERLRRALEDLQGALAEQKRALRDWRFAMAELGIGVAGLGHALGSYQDSLGGVETGLAELRDQARQLEGWAESVSKSSAKAPALRGAASPSGV